MNKEYVYVDGKVVIEDEKGNKRLDSYSDNLDEILVQENLIESLEQIIEQLECEKKPFERDKKKKKYIPWELIIFVPVLLIGMPLVLNFISKSLGMSLVSVLKNHIITLYLSLLSLGGIVAAISVELSQYQSYKKNIKHYDGLESELQYAREELNLAKEKLEELKQEKVNTSENNEFRVVKVNDLEKLQLIRENLLMNFNLGYNSETKEKQLVKRR